MNERDTSEHADLELIAAFRGGLLGAADGDRVAQHLSGCAACTQRQAALDEVTTRLAQAPTPPLPPWLAQRLDAALAAEVAAAQPAAAAPGLAAAAASGEAGGPGPGQAHEMADGHAGTRRARGAHAGRAPAGRDNASRGPAGRNRPGHQRPRRRFLAGALRPLVAAASVCLLAGGGYVLAQSLTHTSPGTSSAARSAAGTPGSAVGPRTPMYAQQAPAAGATGAPVTQAVVVSSSTPYQPGTLRAQAAVVAGRYATDIPSPGKAGYTTVKPSGISSSLAGCLQLVTGGRRGLIVDKATYQGSPAIVIIAPGSGGTRGHVWVVGPACSPTDRHLITSASL